MSPGSWNLQQAYQQVYPHASVIPGEVYLSSGFEAGKNICCAYDESGSLLGYAPLFPALTEDPKHPAYALGGSEDKPAVELSPGGEGRFVRPPSGSHR